MSKFQLIYISNIPDNYHVKNLRLFFRIFIETEKFFVFHFRHRPEILNFNGNLKNIKFKPRRSNHKTLCCFIVIKTSYVNLLLDYFNDKHWLGYQSKEPIPSKCKIILSDSFDEIPTDLISKIIELNSPPDMPNGNVGTPLKFFFNANINCKLSLTVIRKLGLDFNAEYKLNKYQSIPYNYEESNENQIFYHGGHTSILLDDEEYGIYVLFNDGKNQLKKSSNSDLSDQEDKLDFTCTQDDEMEEWERFEELHGDAHDMNKHKNCMLEYERKEEVTWEKGGPGKVLYTDQAFWRDLEPKDKDDFFDEPGNWDFDIETADHLKDALHHQNILKKLNRSKKLKKRKLKQSKFNENIQLPEFALRIMKRFGWVVGSALGTNENCGIKSFDQLFPSEYKREYKERAGLFCDEDIINPINDKCEKISRNRYYGIDKNIRITYFRKFIQSNTNKTKF